MRVIYYYQTFIGLGKILGQGRDGPVTHIHLSSVHFGKIDNKPYIHLNDNPPSDHTFDEVWKDMHAAHNLGIKIMLMIGGGGGAYEALFEDYPTYYGMLKQLLESFPFYGVDLDVEDMCTLVQIQKLMNNLHTDFPDLSFSMAPVVYSLIRDDPGMGGFSYKDLWNSPEGRLIEYFNCQTYGSDIYSVETFNAVTKNGYPAEMIVIGMLAEQDLNHCLSVLKQLQPVGIGGAFVWEYFQAPPDAPANPQEWAVEIKKALSRTGPDTMELMYHARCIIL